MSEPSFEAVIFDMDGVITQTAKTHAQAWKETFDEYLQIRQQRDNEPFQEFKHDPDYLNYVDGKPRYKGVQSFLQSRGIDLPFGDPADAPGKETVCGIGNRKNEKFLKILETNPPQVYSSTMQLIKSLKEKGIKIGVASSSKNCGFLLKSAGIYDLFETRVDGVVSAQLGLHGKPEGDIFTTAARNVGVEPGQAVVVEDAQSGVQAGRNGGFGLVLGVARKDNVDELIDSGADIVVTDLKEVSVQQINQWFQRVPKPLFKNWDKLSSVAEEKIFDAAVALNKAYQQTAQSAIIRNKPIVLFLDYDGTLTPIVDRPDLAVLSDQMKDTLMRLMKKHTVAIASGRMRDDVQKLVGIDGLFYAGSHGFDIAGPNFSLVQEQAQKAIPLISKIIEQLSEELKDIPNILIEEKKFSMAVHYRLVDDTFLPRIQQAVQQCVGQYDRVRLLAGKKVFEILPNIDWDKGKALRWIMRALNIDWSNASVIYIGDDVTDEYALRVVRTRGTGILVASEVKHSAADFQLFSVEEVRQLFEKIIETT